MNRSELFDLVLHSSCFRHQTAACTGWSGPKRSLEQTPKHWVDEIVRLVFLLLVLMLIMNSFHSIFDPHVQRSVALLSVFNYLWMPQFTNLADFIWTWFNRKGRGVKSMLKFVKAFGKGIKLTRMFYQMFKRRVRGRVRKKWKLSG